MSTLAAVLRRASTPFLLLTLAVGLLAGVLARPALAQDGDAATATVDVLPVRGFLDPPVAGAMTDLLDEAATRGSALVVLQVDGPGGISADVAGLIDAVRESPVPVVVFVSPQQGIEAEAGGAYGLLWAAADVRAVSDTATVGPLAPANLSDDVGVVAEDALATEFLGDTPVTSDLVSGSVDAASLEDAGLVDVLAPNVANLLAELDGRTVTTPAGEVTLALPRDGVEVRLHSLGLLGRMLHAAAAPAFIYLLLVIGLALLAFEIFQPGFGVAGVAGLIMLPFAVFGLSVLPVAWWALALAVVGLVLFTVDAALAGLGPVTAAATATFGVGSWFLFGSGPLRVPPVVAVLTTVAAVVFFVVVLTIVLRAQAGPEGVDLADLVGRHGIVRSVLNPEGHVYIDEALWRARTIDGGKMRVGSPVTVADVDGPVLLVEPFDAAKESTADSPSGAVTGAPDES